MKLTCLTVPLLLAAIFTCVVDAAQVTTIQSDNPIARQHGWLKECDDRIAEAQGKQIDILFIGDSITQNFVEDPKGGWNLVGGSVWRKHYANRNALNLGVGSDGTEHVLWRLAHQNVKAFNPKVIVLLIGINDMQFSADDIEAGTKAVLDRCESMYPSAKIVLMAILPNGRNPTKTAAVNQVTQTYADNRTVFFLDLGPYMPRQGKGWKGIGGDQTHLNSEGYEVWASQLDPILNKLITP